MIITVQLVYKLAYYDVPVQHFSHYATGTSPSAFAVSDKYVRYTVLLINKYIYYNFYYKLIFSMLKIPGF